jgi:LuxR family transcriptional regulator
MNNSALDYLTAVTKATSLEELWKMHVEKMLSYGFDRVLYGYTNFRVDHNLGDPEDFVVLTNHDSEYIEEFFDKRMFLHAPMVQWALNNDGACSWAHIGERLNAGSLDKDEQSVLQFNQAMGVTAGYTISFKSISHRSKGAIGLIGPNGSTQAEIDEIWAEHGDELILLNNVVHLKILNLPYRNPNRALTKRQREVLEWVSDGKTIQDIALLMGRTTATVEKHLRLAREAMAVETTAQAVLKAAFQNQIFTTDRP